MPRTRFSKALVIFAMTMLVAFAGAGSSAAQSSLAGNTSERLAEILSGIPPERIPTGILYDRALGLSAIDTHTGAPGSAAVTGPEWRQIIHEIRLASVTTPSWPPLSAIVERSRPATRQGIVPIAIMSFRYARLRPDAIASGALVEAPGGRLAIGTGDPFLVERVFAAAPLREQTYRGERVTFALDRADYFSNDAAAPSRVEIDFDDGRGWVSVPFGSHPIVHYVSPGTKTVRVRAALTSGDALESAFRFDVLALGTPVPHDTLQVTASIPYNGGFGSGEAYVYLSDAHVTLTDPVIVIEGFDLDNSMNWDELYALLNREQLIETLRSMGFDAVVLNFTDAVDYIQRNSFVAVELIEQVQKMIGAQTDIALVGASMGGLVGRYALAYLEDQGTPAAVRTFIAFDSPMAGAQVPLGIQYWLAFFASEAPEAAALLAALDTPGSRQMLAYHYTDPPGPTGESDPLRAQLLADFAGIGDYPSGPRLVAVANGSGAQANQGFAAGAQVIRWEYSNILVQIIGNVWAVPDQTSQLIFRGLIDPIFLPPDAMNVTVAGTRPYDNAPGGYRDSMAQMDGVPAPYGDIVALHPNHCFIPSVSALAVETNDLFYDIAGDPKLVEHTPFDAVYFPSANQDHVQITPENALWFIAEIQRSTAGVAAGLAGTPALTARIDPVVQSPATRGARIRFVAPHAGPARLAIFAPTGRTVAVVMDNHLAAGEGVVDWNGRGAGGSRPAAGIYFVELRGTDFVATRKMLLQ